MAASSWREGGLPLLAARCGPSICWVNGENTSEAPPAPDQGVPGFPSLLRSKITSFAWFALVFNPFIPFAGWIARCRALADSL